MQIMVISKFMSYILMLICIIGCSCDSTNVFLQCVQIMYTQYVITTKNILGKMSKNQTQFNIHQQAQNLAIDLQLMQLYSKSPLQTTETNTRMMGFGALSNLLLHKNAKYNYTHQQRQRDQAWIVNKKADIHPLLKRVQSIKTSMRSYQEQNEKQKTSYFYVGPHDLANQQQYIIKNVEYMKYSLMQDMFNQCGLWTVPKIKKGSKKIKPSLYPHIPSHHYHSQISQKHNCYKKCIKQLLTAQPQPSMPRPISISKQNKTVQNIEWLPTLKQTIKTELWQILYNLRPIENKTKTNKINDSIHKVQLYQLAINALSLVQDQFHLALPTNFDSIVYFLNVNYLRKLHGMYEVRGSLGPVWAIAYALYRAGRKTQFYEYLPDPQLRKMFKQVDEWIREGHPKKMIECEQNKDVFHDQLIYALCGVSKYSNDHLCDPNSLDIAWIFLRNVAIFPEGQAKFRQLQEDIFNAYRSSHFTATKVKNLLYLLCFDQLVLLGPNEMIDYDDYVHFLIILYHSPPYFSLCRNTILLTQKLSEYLTQYIQTLLTSDPENSAYYISLMPHETIISEISALLLSTKMLFKVQWKVIQKLVPQIIFKQLVKQSCQKWVKKFGDYLMTAQLVHRLLEDDETCFVILMKLALCYLSGVKVDKNQLNQCLTLATNLLNQNQKLSLEYKSVLQFINEHMRLHNKIETRNEHELYKTLKQLQHILISSNIRISTKQLLQKLIQLNSSSSYILYMKDVIKAYEICYTKMGKVTELGELYRITLEAVVGVMRDGRDGVGVARVNFGDLVAMLEEGLYRLG